MPKFSRESRIITLLVIDTIFFFVEIITGYTVKSLALIADSFHMLNDVLSLVIALWAIKIGTRPSSERNSYGWQRAEILGALLNGTFLLALCLSIFMEAIERFFNINEISNPKLVIIVGSLGLASNVIGLFLFHEHGHSHGGHTHSGASTPSSVSHHVTSAEEFASSPESVPVGGHHRSKSRPRGDSFNSLFGHPAQTRAMVLEAAQEYGYGSPPTHPSLGRSRSGANAGRHGSGDGRSGLDSLVERSRERSTHDHAHDEHGGPDHGHADENGHAGDQSNGKATAIDDDEHSHADEDVGGGAVGGHGHGHGSMNMHGVFLHVLGDALGNVGVISAGLVILLGHGKWKYYFDPAISLLITCIIFSSALPLVKSASYILLQGVPHSISLEDVRVSINEVPGVLSLHELHIWQLSEKTIVASVHVLIAKDKDYMEVANGIRKALHEHGVHSSTIQPEFGDEADDVSENACLIRCPPETCAPETCCPPTGKLVDVDGNPSDEQPPPTGENMV